MKRTTSVLASVAAGLAAYALAGLSSEASTTALRAAETGLADVPALACGNHDKPAAPAPAPSPSPSPAPAPRPPPKPAT